MRMKDGVVIDIFTSSIALRIGGDSGCSLIINMVSMPSVAIEAVLSKSISKLIATLHYLYRTLTCPLMSWGTRLQCVEYSAPLLLLLPRPLCSVLPSQCGTERTPSAVIVSSPVLIRSSSNTCTYHVPSQVILLLFLKSPEIFHHTATSVLCVLFCNTEGLL